MLGISRILRGGAPFLLLAAITAATALPATAMTIVDEWPSVKMPKAPKLKPVKVDVKTTALLVLDLVNRTCNEKRRPRCVKALPEVAKLIKGARDHRVFIVYSSIIHAGKVAAILPAVKPMGNEPEVAAHADKFLHTDLNKILKGKGIKTVIIVGTTAEGAVLYTASEAAFRGYKVIVPVEGSTSGTKFGEAATLWMLSHAPAVGRNTTLTSMDMISY